MLGQFRPDRSRIFVRAAILLGVQPPITVDPSAARGKRRSAAVRLALPYEQEQLAGLGKDAQIIRFDLNHFDAGVDARHRCRRSRRAILAATANLGHFLGVQSARR
jgi:hypothetical protein